MAEQTRPTLAPGPTLAPTGALSWTRLVWAGEIDTFSVRPLAVGLRRACAQEPVVLEVDLSGVTFMDSAGLAPLVEARERLRHRLRLFAPAPAVTRVMGLIGVQDDFVVVGPLPAAPPVAATARPQVSTVGGESAGPGDAAPPGTLRVTVEQAKGLLMAVHGCGASEAEAVLHSHARAHGVGVDVMAALMVSHAPGAAPPSSETVVDDVMAERARAGSPAD